MNRLNALVQITIFAFVIFFAWVQPINCESNADDLGTLWRVEEVGWTGDWVREGNSSVFKALMKKGNYRVTYEADIKIEHNQVRVSRLDSSDHNDCIYEGIIADDGVTVIGLGRCAKENFLIPFNWKAVIEKGNIDSSPKKEIKIVLKNGRIILTDHYLEKNDIITYQQFDGQISIKKNIIKEIINK